MAVRGDGDRVLEMRRQRPVGGHHGPAVGQDCVSRPPDVHHRLDRDDQPGLRRATTGRAVVRDLGVLVQRAADPVPDVLAHDREPCRLRHLLDRVADVARAGRPADTARSRRPAPPRSPARASRPRSTARAADEHGHRGVAVEALPDRAEVQRQQVALRRAPAWPTGCRGRSRRSSDVQIDAGNPRYPLNDGRRARSRIAVSATASSSAVVTPGRDGLASRAAMVSRE